MQSSFRWGIIGIVSTAAIAWKLEGESRRRRGKRGRNDSAAAILALVFTGMMLCGNLATTADELVKAPYRKERYEEKITAALNYQEYSDKELEDIFEYRKGPEKIRKGLKDFRDKSMERIRS